MNGWMWSTIVLGAVVAYLGYRIVRYFVDMMEQWP